MGRAATICSLWFSATLALGCGDQHALLLTVTAERSIAFFDLTVKDLTVQRIVLARNDEVVDPNDQQRDISADARPLRLAIEVSRPGRLLVQVVGKPRQGSAVFGLGAFDVAGSVSGTIRLRELSEDRDGDGIPACGSRECDGAACQYLDCDDQDRAVHPLASESCGNGKDDDCSAGCAVEAGQGDQPCEDRDGDGVSPPADCDDNDPCRAQGLVEAANSCGNQPFPRLPQACLDKLARQGKTLAVPYCGDGIDQDCSGQDIPCRTDADCDGFAAEDDCDDNDPKRNPAAVEICDGIDNNCNQTTDEGCVACDVDGDGHASPMVTDPNCQDDQGKPLPKDDPDDFDAGVFGGATDNTAGKEGQNALAALRGYCSYEKNKDGQRQRDVDHDGDGAPAKDDGCPSDACDLDGDGFARASCEPVIALQDCDDSDATAFPGAPDRCGDNIKQNCVSDVSCSAIVDQDGDGYDATVDCDDHDKARHPWALEICDGLDNDCDGLVDEGNPDVNGKLIPTGPDARLCNSNNEGECGGGGAKASAACKPGSTNCSAGGRVLSGVCACSRAQPQGVFASDRAACAGEDLAAAVSLRCFGAVQPTIERCDDKDWDCDGRLDDPQGTSPLLDKGKQCGTDLGSCVAGIVVGCDLSKTIDHAELVAKVLSAQSLDFNPHWVCSAASPTASLILPRPEVCNGRDDDCDGQAESDSDGDGYLACGGCQGLAGDLALLASLKGCDDCQPAAGAVYPGALELCNKVDDDCDGTTADGSGQCTGGQSCCADNAPGSRCVNTQTDFDNCGGCGKACDAAVSDRCQAGKCACGSGSECGPGLSCESGSCKCLPATSGGRCAGCCDGTTTCRGGDQQAACGSAGATCLDCGSGGACQAGSCNCNGCLDAGLCVTGTATSACGSGGGSCLVCSGSDCTEPTCDGTNCGTLASNEGNPCNASAGVCRSGACCDGLRCTSASACVAGTSDTQCGNSGAPCVDCTTSGQVCDGAAGNCKAP